MRLLTPQRLWCHSTCSLDYCNSVQFIVCSKDLELLQYVKNSATRVHTGANTPATHQLNPHQLASVQVPYRLQNPPSHPQTPLGSCSLVSFWSNTTNLILVLEHSPALQPSRLSQSYLSCTRTFCNAVAPYVHSLPILDIFSTFSPSACCLSWFHSLVHIHLDYLFLYSCWQSGYI